MIYFVYSVGFILAIRYVDNLDKTKLENDEWVSGLISDLKSLEEIEKNLNGWSFIIVCPKFVVSVNIQLLLFFI
jgi:hypothetical protein